MIEPRTTTIYQLAERWSLEPEQIIDAAIDGKIGLYFWFDGNIHDASKGAMHEDRYQDFLQANADTLRAMIATGSSRTITAILDGQEVVITVLRTGPQEWKGPGDLPSPIEMVLSAYTTIKIDDLHALTDEIKAHEKTRPAPANRDDWEALELVSSASDAPLVAGSAGDEAMPKARRRALRDAVLPYMRTVFDDGQFATAKEFYRALEEKAGQADSPFERGTDRNRGSLFVREFSKTLALRTFQNYYWPELKNA